MLYLAVAQSQYSQPPQSLVAPVVDEIFSLTGTRAAPITGTRISSLIVRHAAPTYMKDYTVPSGGDYAVHRGASVHLNGTNACMVDHCVFDAVGGNAVWLTDYNRNSSVVGNEMRLLGENGVGMTGSTTWVDGRGGDQPRFNTIEGNLIHHVGLFTKQSCAIFSATSCQNTIKENVLFHAPRALFNLNDGFGGDSHIERNFFFASMLETKDHGPVNTWDRQPYLTTVRNGTASLVLAYNHFTENFFLGPSGTMALDTDDGSDMVNATANVMYESGLWKCDFGGHSKAYQNNVVIFSKLNACGGGTGTSKYDYHTTHMDYFTGNRCIGHGTKSDCNEVNLHHYIRDNFYYVNQSNISSKGVPTCTNKTTMNDFGSLTLPLPSTDGVIALARAALKM